MKKDFYEIQSLQWKKILFVFTALIFFTFAAVGLVSLAVVLSLGFFGTRQDFWTGPFIGKLLGFDLLVSALIARGDAFYVTLVCSLANSFEKLKEALEPEHPEPQPGLLGRGTRGGGGRPALIYVAAAISSFVMRLLSTLISRERELLADAAAVEFGR